MSRPEWPTEGELTEPEFVARAESERRRGRSLQAKQIALEGLESAPDRHSGRIALALALLDLGDLTEAQAQLSRYLSPSLEALSESEVELGVGDEFDALDRGGGKTHVPVEPDGDPPDPSSESSYPVNPTVPAEETAPRAMKSAESGVDSTSPSEFSLDRSPAFATQTMAGLLEQQGDFTRADVIRGQLDQQARSVRGKGRVRLGTESKRVLETLGVWLRNIQREKP